MSVLPIPVGPKRATTSSPLRVSPAIGSPVTLGAPVLGRRGSGEAREQPLLAGERGAGGRLDVDVDQLARSRGAREVDGLVVAVGGGAARGGGGGGGRPPTRPPPPPAAPGGAPRPPPA